MTTARPHRIETAGQHMVEHVPRIDHKLTAESALLRLRGREFDYIDTIFAVTAEGRLTGMVSMAHLLAAAPGTPLEKLAQPPIHGVQPETDQERVASIAVRHGLAAVPVLDETGRLLGAVPPQALIEVLRHEHVEDLHRLAGIRHETLRARHAIEAPPLRRARDRLPWLLAGLAGSALATLVMASFEDALRTTVAIVFFVPAIVYLADAVGTQTEAIAVRGISLSHVPIAQLVGGEARTGGLIGLTLGSAAFILIWLWLGDARLAAAVGIALLTASAVATTIGFAFPYMLARLGRDPAYGSGPLATIIQDVLSLLIYLAAVTLIVR